MPVLTIIGDVHGSWDDVDEGYLRSAGQDLALFVGDFGDEDVALVERIARLECPKAVILGNHDAWDSMSGRDLGRVRRQIEALGDDHLAYRSRLLGDGSLGVVGARSFTWGGRWNRYAAFFRELYGHQTEEDSAAAIAGAAFALGDVPFLFIGHNGPRGLGGSRDSIFGADFTVPPRDHGDRDLEMAIDELRGLGRRVIATVAGHMHERLLFGGHRKRVIVEDGVIHLNVAVVPRHRKSDGGRVRHFARMVVEGGRVTVAEDLWVGDAGEVVSSESLLG